MITIFGATGRVGRATVLELVSRGAQVRAVAHTTAPDPQLLDVATAVSADLRDPEAIAVAVRESDAVLAVCPLPSRAADPLEDAREMIAGLSQGLGTAGPGAIVAISDYGAEIPTGTGVTGIFYELETRLNELDVPRTYLRSAEHMHNWARQIPAAVRTGVLASMHQPLTKLFPTVHAADLGGIAAELLLSPPPDGASPRIVYAEGPRRYTVLDVSAALSTVTGTEITAGALPRGEWEAMLVRAGATPRSADLIAELYDAHNDGLIDVVAGAEIRRGPTELLDALGSVV